VSREIIKNPLVFSQSASLDEMFEARSLSRRQGPLSSKVRANELPLLQKGSASVSLAVSRILRDTSSIVAALSKRHADSHCS
jgi:hypothetical protein